jgi:O-antigen ligase
MNTNTLALAVGVVAFLLGHAAPRIMPIIISSGLALWLLAAPFITAALLPTLRAMESLPMSWRMRLEIWNFAIARIGEQPLIGYGLDGARAYQGQLLDINGFQFPAIPLHPHSFSLHVWLETGAIGAALGALSLIAIGIGVSRGLGRHRGAAAAACGVIAAIGAIWNVSYGAWQEWWVAVPFVAAFLCAAARRELPPAMSDHS